MAVPISNVTRRQVYSPSGSGGAGPYSFTFEILANTDIAVYKDDTLLTLTTHYTVTINANGTGSVTITAAGLALSPTSPTQYAIVGNRTIQRTSDFTTGGDFFANTINDELDQQTIFAQQNSEGLQRALTAPQTDPTSIDMTLPRASVRANKTLAFDSNGDPTTGEVIGDNRGNWSAAVAYNKRDIVKDTSNGNVYYANTSHTSSGSQPISTNADSAKWDLIVDNASAGSSATAAAASASAAATSASNASTSASNASTSATNAAASASTASTQASNASTSATNAAASASTASTQASNASTSATNAAASASTASTQASNASTSASNASTSATNAANSASTATTQATNASNSASAASTSASNASTSATNAANSATASASSATSAAASAAAAAASFDAFDDIYLGAKSSDPSVDNDGNALTTGDQYFNTTANELRVYNGSTWQAASTVGGTVTSLSVTGATTLGQNPILSGGTANGVAYLNGSKVLTTGSALVFDGTNLGVGTSSPAAKFEVSTGAATKMRLTSTADNNADIDFYTNSVQRGIIEFNSVGGLIYTVPSLPLTFGTNNTERARIDSAGNLGLGVTPSAWDSTYKAIQVGARSMYYGIGTETNMNNNAYYNAGWKYVANAGAGIYSLDANSHKWYIAPSGTAGNAISFTQAMTLDASGRLGIGTTSPGTRLQLGDSSSGTSVLRIHRGAGSDYTDIWSDIGSTVIDTVGGGNLFVRMGGSTKATIDANGNLGIGATAPQNKLQVVTTTRPQFSVSYNGTTGLYLEDATNSAWKSWKLSTSFGNGSDLSFVQSTNTSGTPTWAATAAMTLDASGNLLVADTSQIGAGKLSIKSDSAIATKGTTATGFGNWTMHRADTGAKIWEITGDSSTWYLADADFSNYVYVSQNFTAWTFGSDRRIKTDIADIEYGLDAVMAMKPRKYKMLATGLPSIGFIAQELQTVVPEAVEGEEIEYLDSDTPKEKAAKTMGVSKDTLIPVLVKAIQELKAEFDAYKASHP